MYCLGRSAESGQLVDLFRHRFYKYLINFSAKNQVLSSSLDHSPKFRHVADFQHAGYAQLKVPTSGDTERGCGFSASIL